MGIYINRSQTYECGNWDGGRAIPFLDIFVSNFRYCVFAMAYMTCGKWNLVEMQEEGSTDASVAYMLKDILMETKSK